MDLAVISIFMSMGITDDRLGSQSSEIVDELISRVAPYGIRRPSGPYSIQFSLSLTLSLLCRHSFGYMISWHSWLLLGSAISKLDTKTSRIELIHKDTEIGTDQQVITRPMSFVYEKLSRNLESRSHVVHNARNAVYCVPRHWVFCKLCF